MNALWRQVTRITGRKKGSLEKLKNCPGQSLYTDRVIMHGRALGWLVNHYPDLKTIDLVWHGFKSFTLFGCFLPTWPCISVSLFNTKTQEHKTLCTTISPIKIRSTLRNDFIFILLKRWLQGDVPPEPHFIPS